MPASQLSTSAKVQKKKSRGALIKCLSPQVHTTKNATVAKKKKKGRHNHRLPQQVQYPLVTVQTNKTDVTVCCQKCDAKTSKVTSAFTARQTVTLSLHQNLFNLKFCSLKRKKNEPNAIKLRWVSNFNPLAYKLYVHLSQCTLS